MARVYAEYLYNGQKLVQSTRKQRIKVYIDRIDWMYSRNVLVLTRTI